MTDMKWHDEILPSGATKSWLCVPAATPQPIDDSIAALVIAFRRWCKRKGVEPPSVAEYQDILDEAANLREANKL